MKKKRNIFKKTAEVFGAFFGELFGEVFGELAFYIVLFIVGGLVLSLFGVNFLADTVDAEQVALIGLVALLAVGVLIGIVVYGIKRRKKPMIAVEMDPAARYYVYILANKKNGILYINYTDQLQETLAERKKGSPVHRLVYVEGYKEQEEAERRKKELREMDQKTRTALIENTNLNWLDLSVHCEDKRNEK